MDDDFFEIWTGDFERPWQPERVAVNQKNFANELAFHEASHFVIGRLVNNLNIGFSEATSIVIDSVNKKSGVVSGFGGEIQFDNMFWSNSNRKKFKEFYTSDTKRIWAECLELIAGYASYKLFLEDREDFISYLPSNTSTEALMHKLDTVPHRFWYTHADKHSSGISDFVKIKERLSFIDIVDEDELVRVYNRLLKVVCEIMNTRAVEYAIRYVKNKLKASDGKVIEGRVFERMKWFADNLISKVTISDSVRILYNHYKN